MLGGQLYESRAKGWEQQSGEVEPGSNDLLVLQLLHPRRRGHAVGNDDVVDVVGATRLPRTALLHPVLERGTWRALYEKYAG